MVRACCLVVEGGSGRDKGASRGELTLRRLVKCQRTLWAGLSARPRQYMHAIAIDGMILGLGMYYKSR